MRGEREMSAGEVRRQAGGRWKASVDGGLHGADGRCPKRSVGVFFAWVVVKEGREDWGSPRRRRGADTGNGMDAQHLSTSAATQ